jgi:hypothetical protein
MMFWSKKKHRLPKFPPDVRPSFRNACIALSSEGAHELRKYLDDAIAGLREQFDKTGQVDIQKAELIYERCVYLLDNYDRFNRSGRALIVGAVKYFAVQEDPFASATFASGLVDDAKVLNHVLEELGIEDKYIPIV